jgi:8-oxo-dGTP pyrophosphatase MutT (NUDIX family)
VREPFPPHDAFVALIRERLSGPLPGSPAQALMAPRPRSGWKPGRVPDEARPAGALLLLYPSRGRSHLLLTLRSDRIGRHRGQVSLPGGAVEVGEDAVAAAIREAHEEAGVDPLLPRVLGALTPLDVPVSGYVIHPVVAASATRPDFEPCGHEVERVVEVGVRELADPANLRVETWTREWGTAEVPFFRVGGLTVWGATAMVLGEFLALVGAPPSPSFRRDNENSRTRSGGSDPWA